MGLASNIVSFKMEANKGEMKVSDCIDSHVLVIRKDSGGGFMKKD